MFVPGQSINPAQTRSTQEGRLPTRTPAVGSTHVVPLAGANPLPILVAHTINPEHNPTQNNEHPEAIHDHPSRMRGSAQGQPPPGSHTQSIRRCSCLNALRRNHQTDDTAIKKSRQCCRAYPWSLCAKLNRKQVDGVSIPSAMGTDQ